ncbi:hypothetical protein BD414DRAFT_501687 [Trametes punicea]|nr:hypothetical protein BD414DRAFT_501687 [Trametes punicea]
MGRKDRTRWRDRRVEAIYITSPDGETSVDTTFGAPEREHDKQYREGGREDQATKTCMGPPCTETVLRASASRGVFSQWWTASWTVTILRMVHRYAEYASSSAVVPLSLICAFSAWLLLQSEMRVQMNRHRAECPSSAAMTPLSLLCAFSAWLLSSAAMTQPSLLCASSAWLLLQSQKRIRMDRRCGEYPSSAAMTSLS